MFYKEKKENFWWFKSDKDNFFFWPFDRLLEDDEIKLKCVNFKTWKHIGWNWKNKNFLFEDRNWLNLCYFDSSLESWDIKIFILLSIKTFEFIDKEKIKFLQNVQPVEIGFIKWLEIKLSKQSFIENLPLLNGFVNKFGFVFSSLADTKICKLNFMLDFEFSETKFDILNKKIEEIKTYLTSDNLLTFSKKEEFISQLRNGLFFLVSYAIKLYYLIDEVYTNKKELWKIIKSNYKQEYVWNAKLLEKVSSENVELFIEKLKIILAQISFIVDFLDKFKSVYLK